MTKKRMGMSYVAIGCLVAALGCGERGDEGASANAPPPVKKNNSTDNSITSPAHTKIALQQLLRLVPPPRRARPVQEPSGG
jgi:hypothetical protein